jgi:hypothetical protein
VTIALAGLSILFLSGTCFLLLLVRTNLSPTAAIYKILGRFGKAPEQWRPGHSDAPYRQTRRINGDSHRPILLNLNTSDGSGQACHPDVVYVPGGFGSNGWTYWMACTPYPYGDDSLENPEVFASHDGLNWAVPDGANNPLANALSKRGDHNSDTDLLFVDGELWLYYRETIRSKIPNENRIYLIKSEDGVRWSARVKVLMNATDRELLSPAVIHDGAFFHMWTVEVTDGKCCVFRRTSHDGVTWDEPKRVTVIGLGTRQPWHIDVLREDDRLSALLVSCAGLGGAKARLHYAFSTDGGNTWITQGFLFEQLYEFESDVQYRSTFRLSGIDPPQYQIWYSARNANLMFSIAYVQARRDQNQLLPSLPQLTDMIQGSGTTLVTEHRERRRD